MRAVCLGRDLNVQKRNIHINQVAVVEGICSGIKHRQFCEHSPDHVDFLHDSIGGTDFEGVQTVGSRHDMSENSEPATVVGVIQRRRVVGEIEEEL